MNAYAIIMAGGSGERLWPLSTTERPKQFVSLFGGKPLIRHAVDRLNGLIPPERIFVITAKRLAAMTRRALPSVPACNIIGEPCRRDTAAAVAVACGLVKRCGGDDAVGCILTADHLISPFAAFRKTLKDAIRAASKTSSIVTIGIEPDRPAEEFGYIECGGEAALGVKSRVQRVKRFVEKPDAKTARGYLATNRFLWNSGMFIWRAATLEKAFFDAAEDMLPMIEKVARLKDASAVMRREYPSLRRISFDYAVMEKCEDILVVSAGFKWDDVGSWLSAAKYLPHDGSGNARLGNAALLDVSGSVAVASGGHTVAMIGVKNLVVVHTAKATLVCPSDRLQDIRKLLAGLPS